MAAVKSAIRFNVCSVRPPFLFSIYIYRLFCHCHGTLWNLVIPSGDFVIQDEITITILYRKYLYFKMDEDILIMCAAAVACIGAIKFMKKKRQRRSMWVNPLLKERESKGRFETTVRNSYFLKNRTELYKDSSLFFLVWRHDRFSSDVQRKLPYERWVFWLYFRQSGRNIGI